MASAGGARAAGSNLKDEGKFRQRVVNYYKIMADARKGISLYCKNQLAAALGLAGAAGVSAVMASSALSAAQLELDAAKGKASAAEAAVAALSNEAQPDAAALAKERAAEALAAETLKAAEAAVEAASGLPDTTDLVATALAVLALGLAYRAGLGVTTMQQAGASSYRSRCLLSLLLVVAMAGLDAMMQEVQSVAYAKGALAVLALLSSALGLRAAGSLLYAFELQAEKKSEMKSSAAPATTASSPVKMAPPGRAPRRKA
jgi:hypothetical protein